MRPAEISGRQSPMERTAEDVVRRVLDRHGRTFAAKAGIARTDEPAPLFQLLVLAQLLSARIGAGVAVVTARELFRAGWTTPARLRAAGRGAVVGALGRGGYRRYDERTATQLREMAELVLHRYDGDLRRLAEEADGDARADPGGQQLGQRQELEQRRRLVRERDSRVGGERRAVPVEHGAGDVLG